MAHATGAQRGGPCSPIWRGSTHRHALHAWLPGRAGRLLVVVHVGLAAVFLGWVLMRLVAVGEGRVVVLVVVDLGIVAVLLRHGQTLLPPDDRPIRCSAVAGVAVITAVAGVGVTVAAGVGGIAVVTAVAVCVRGVGVAAAVAVAHGRTTLGA